MRIPALSALALVALAGCNSGTQSAELDTEEAEAGGNIVGNSSASKPSAESEAPAEDRGAVAGPGPAEETER